MKPSPSLANVGMTTFNARRPPQWFIPVKEIERILPLLVALVLFVTFILSFQLDDSLAQQDLPWLQSNVPTESMDLPESQDRVHLIVVSDIPKTPSKNLWDDNPNLPSWMKDYFRWHAETRKVLDKSTWERNQYLILRCYREDARCGGLSDRLKPVPLLLLAAARSKRLLFISWTRPCALEEFLLPPAGGINWTMPPWLRQKAELNTTSRRLVTRASSVLETVAESATIVQTHLHDASGGASQYTEVEGENEFYRVYHDLFRIFFEPSPYIAQRVQGKMLSHGLVPGQYAVAHYRAEYGREVARHPKLRKPSFISGTAINAVNCASELQPGSPIFFASDNMIALEAVRSFAKKVNFPIVTFEREEANPLHLDKFDNETKPKDYTSTFVDLFLAGNGRCVAYGRGGFGRYANMLSFNATCSKKHVKNFFSNPCEWANRKE